MVIADKSRTPMIDNRVEFPHTITLDHQENRKNSAHVIEKVLGFDPL